MILRENMTLDSLSLDVGEKQQGLMEELEDQDNGGSQNLRKMQKTERRRRKKDTTSHQMANKQEGVAYRIHIFDSIQDLESLYIRLICEYGHFAVLITSCTGHCSLQIPIFLIVVCDSL